MTRNEKAEIISNLEAEFKASEAIVVCDYRGLSVKKLEQIKTSINFENTMIGVYAGTVDTSKLKDKSCLSWLPIK